MRLKRAVLLFSWLAAAFGYACTRVEPAGAPPEVAIGDAGFGGEVAGGSGSLAGEGGDGRGGTSVTVGGAPGSVELGLWPTFAPEQEQGTAAEAVLASIAALSLGSGTLPVYERWDTLSSATGAPRAMAWSLLDDVVAPYRERNRSLALCIGVVDRTLPAWPVTGEVNSVAARLAMERTIDEAFARYAAQLSHLCFGYEVDRYLASVSEPEGDRVLELLEHAIDYARAHPLKSPRTALGVAITMVAASDTAQLEALALGDEVVTVYDPLDQDGELRAPESIAADLEAVLEALPRGDDDQAPPLTLFEAGYPSSADAGSSETAQRAFYETLFGALELRVDQVGFVGLFGLGDRAESICASEAISFAAPEEARAAARCTIGLRAKSGSAKAAWPSVLSALSSSR